MAHHNHGLHVDNFDDLGFQLDNLTRVVQQLISQNMCANRGRLSRNCSGMYKEVKRDQGMACRNYQWCNYGEMNDFQSPSVRSKNWSGGQWNDSCWSSQASDNSTSPVR